MPHFYYCFDCVAGCFRTYGEIVWIKCGSYRWWPGQIVHVANAPKNIVSRFQTHGQFIVQFFGSLDYIWTDQGRVFLYEEEDKVIWDRLITIAPLLISSLTLFHISCNCMNGICPCFSEMAMITFLRFIGNHGNHLDEIIFLKYLLIEIKKSMVTALIDSLWKEFLWRM